MGRSGPLNSASAGEEVIKSRHKPAWLGQHPSYRARALFESVRAHGLGRIWVSEVIRSLACCLLWVRRLLDSPTVAPQAFREPSNAALCVRSHAGCDGCGRLVFKVLMWHRSSNHRSRHGVIDFVENGGRQSLIGKALVCRGVFYL
jgi:hypothetical protein